MSGSAASQLYWGRHLTFSDTKITEVHKSELTQSAKILSSNGKFDAMSLFWPAAHALAGSTHLLGIDTLASKIRLQG